MLEIKHKISHSLIEQSEERKFPRGIKQLSRDKIRAKFQIKTNTEDKFSERGQTNNYLARDQRKKSFKRTK